MYGFQGDFKLGATLARKDVDSGKREYREQR